MGGGGGVELPLVVFLLCLLGDREREEVGTWAAIFVVCAKICRVDSGEDDDDGSAFENVPFTVALAIPSLFPATSALQKVHVQQPQLHVLE